MLNGPRVQDNLSEIITRWRTFPVAVTTDISKMYLQIRIDNTQFDLQRIIWREKHQEPIKHYRLKRLTFGLKAAPFLATKCLEVLADTEAENFPEAAKVLKNNFYIDDGMFGSHTVEGAISLQKQLTQLLGTAGFTPQKWATNCAAVLSTINGIQPQAIASDSVSTLGLQWLPDEDTFYFKIQQPIPKVVTKRQALSQAAKIFDPLGWLSPVTIFPKLYLQKLWKVQMDWDEPVPENMALEWSDYVKQINIINQIKIPRFLGTSLHTEISLHGFSDASEKAYGAAIYVRTKTTSGYVCNLVASKSRVAPVKTMSIPRLELNAAVLLSRFMETVIKSLQIQGAEIYYYTDSSIVLIWISEPSYVWQTFIANRVATIQNTSKRLQWQHVPSSQNPADKVSRGCSSMELLEDRQWWHGPEWLISGERPPQPILSRPVTDRKVIAAVSKIQPFVWESFDNLTTMCNATAFARRFLKRKRSDDPINAEEFEEALQCLIRQSQKRYMAAELKAIERGQKSRIANLNPFLHTDGLIRINGRLSQANLPFQERHQILLPPKSRIERELVLYTHRRLCHAGVQLILASLRSKYWILHGRRAIKKIIHTCLRCFKLNPRLGQQMMAPLPAARTSPAKPFTFTGLDYAGPISIKVGSRSKANTKAYIAVFVCMATRAIHLEAVSDLSTAAFLAALRRFIARRGPCQTIQSDNATTFKGSQNEPHELQTMLLEDKDTIIRQLTTQGISWKFNAPLAPHQGGLWEAGVKSVKYHLRRVMGITTFNFEELITTLCQIEACLNSRPLCPLSDDPSDVAALTPGHFLLGCSPTILPDTDLLDTPVNRLDRWQLIQRATWEFWRRWKSEYLVRLQSRPKWLFPTKPLQINDLVILRDDNLPPLQWRLGRIKPVHPGPDGMVRNVTVTTGKSSFTRAVQSLALLPTSQSINQSHSDEDNF